MEKNKEAGNIRTPAATKKSIAGWCLYDFANSAFVTVIITFVFSVYFARSVVGDETHGSALWSYGIAASGLVVAVLGPLAGAVADQYGARKPGVVMFSLFSMAATALLFFIAPIPGALNIAAALGLLLLANLGYELALVFANAMLPHIAPAEKIGRVSGWGWGLGYLGGLLCLVLALFGLIGVAGGEPFLPLPTEEQINIRATVLLVALWFFIFSLPLYLWTKDEPRSGLSVYQAGRAGLRQLGRLVKTARTEGNLLKFLIGSAIYRDGLSTIFAMGGLYAAGIYGMDYTEILIFAMGLNVTAGIGAAGFAFLDDAIGSRRTVILALLGLIGTGVAILLVTQMWWFIGLALILGLFVGPVQAASRTLASRITPEEKIGQTYGLYALTGKSVAFTGPFLYGLATAVFDTQRAGMCVIIGLWIIGLGIIWQVRDYERDH